MAFHHCVMFRWTADVDADHLARIRASLDTMPANVATIRGYHHGSDAGVNPGNYDYVVVGEFDDVEGYLAYRDHPYHTAFIAELITGYVAERGAVQFTS
ncbi:MAG TPA: Dabb family protein [Ilumatobacter sp.]|nr:Dabb family protein [Ilumatobacter sp.]